MPRAFTYTKEINQELYKRNFELAIRNKTLSLLRKLYDITLAMLDTKKLGTKIVTATRASLDMEFSGLYSIDKKKRALLPIAVALSPGLKKLSGKVNERVESLSISLKDRNHPCVKALKTNKKQKVKNFQTFWNSKKDGNILTDLKKNNAVKSVIIAPLINEQESLGVFILAFDRPYKGLSRFEYDAIENILSVVKIALNKARIYEELRSKNITLKQVNKDLNDLLQMKSEFLQIASHQLRTPLTAIRGLLSLQFEGSFDHLPNDELQKIRHNMLVSSERLNNIVNDLLKATELEGGIVGEFITGDVELLVKQSIETLSPNYEKKKLQLTFIPPAEKLPLMEMKEGFLQQVFLNLIDNAERYTPSGSVEIKLYQKNNFIVFEIKDSGIGVAPEDKQKLFEKFGRGSKAKEIQPNGSGLGLFIIKRIVEEHKGKIEMNSEGRDKGTTFKITLPVRQSYGAGKNKQDSSH
ncbi:MAG TPA: HAMP domain-containing sensor histidine kinase [Patescibacteria group bacterium]|nr:HAMP domain-containing sensor histidine kinase [Patescibacteria group bacterium]